MSHITSEEYLKNLNCPSCNKNIYRTKFLFFTPDKIFNCGNCKTKIQVKSSVSNGWIFYGSLPFLLLSFAYVLVEQSVISYLLLGAVSILSAYLCHYFEKVSLVGEKPQPKASDKTHRLSN